MGGDFISIIILVLLDHQNYTGIDENLGPIAVSLRREPMAADSGREKFQYRIIVRTSDVIKKNRENLFF